MPIFDHLQLDQVAETASRLGRQTFLFTATPLNIEGATGSPLTPLAIF
jgi:kynurenine formamidase